MALEQGDDLAAHEKTTAEAWRESYYCNFFDADSDVHGLAWLGVRPNAGVGEVLFALFDGGEPIVRYLDFQHPVDPDVGEERNQLGNLRFEPVEPWSRWKVIYEDGDDRAEVDWRQFSAMCDWEFEDVTASKHFQAAGRVDVKADIGGREIEFSGTGERDRAWGERDYGSWTYVWWMIVQFPDETASHIFLFRDEDGKDRLHGYLHKDGVTRDLATYEADVEYSPDEGPPVSTRHTITDVDGRELKLTESERLHHFSFSATSHQIDDSPPDGLTKGRMFWTFHRFTRDDGALGRGMIDYVFWTGNQPERIEATGPSYSTIYEYGLENGG